MRLGHKNKSHTESKQTNKQTNKHTHTHTKKRKKKKRKEKKRESKRKRNAKPVSAPSQTTHTKKNNLCNLRYECRRTRSLMWWLPRQTGPHSAFQTLRLLDTTV